MKKSRIEKWKIAFQKKKIASKKILDHIVDLMRCFPWGKKKRVAN